MNDIVTIVTDASKWLGKLAHTWNYIGYDECNYTHSPGGMELIRKFGKMEKPYYVRCHHLLCTGNLHGFYKWGSTNAYLEDEDGNPVYNFDLIDRMCDIWLSNNCKPFFEIGFMPMHLADMSGAESRPGGAMSEYRRIGWSRPPKDYDRWYELISKLITHLLERYGKDELESWYFEMWNEPDIVYWSGTHGEFCKLYDYTEAAVHDVLPTARFGGPATCGAHRPDETHSVYLRDFLVHCKSGVNYKSGKTGTRLDFTSFHTKGGAYGSTSGSKVSKTPSVESFITQIRNGAGIIKECGYGHLECVLSEADPDGWAAGGRFDNPALNFRNTEYYASYVAATYKKTYDLAEELGMDIRPLAWAFMFEGERCFEGTRTFSTQGIDKAVLNTLRLMAKLGEQRIELVSSEAMIDGWATLTGTKSFETLVYCHEDTWSEDEIYNVKFSSVNLPFDGSCRIRHYRIDKGHSNAYAEWVRQGKPDYPQDEQYRVIKSRDGLELLCPDQIVTPNGGRIDLCFDMPVKSISLIVIEQLN